MSAPNNSSPLPENKKTASVSWANSKIYGAVWDGANFITVAATTSLGVVAIQSPFRTIILNLLRNQRTLPPIHVRAGSFVWMAAMLRGLYQGSQASLSGSAFRSAYIIGTKNGNPDKVIEEQNVAVNPNNQVPLPHLLLASLGDLLITQIPGVLADHQRTGLVPPEFNWRTRHNMWQLMSSCFFARYSTSMINFSMLCVVEQELAMKLEHTDPRFKHFASGALSGVAAGLLTTPLSLFIDHTQIQSKVEQGNLYNQSSLKNAIQLKNQFVANPYSSMLLFLRNAAQQMPPRIILRAAIFGIVAGLGDILGTHPLEQVVPETYQPPPTPQGGYSRFFKQKIAKEEAKPLQAHEDNGVMGKNDKP